MDPPTLTTLPSEVLLLILEDVLSTPNVPLPDLDAEEALWEDRVNVFEHPWEEIQDCFRSDNIILLPKPKALAQAGAPQPVLAVSRAIRAVALVALARDNYALARSCELDIGIIGETLLVTTWRKLPNIGMVVGGGGTPYRRFVGKLKCTVRTAGVYEPKREGRIYCGDLDNGSGTYHGFGFGSCAANDMLDELTCLDWALCDIFRRFLYNGPPLMAKAGEIIPLNSLDAPVGWSVGTLVLEFVCPDGDGSGGGGGSDASRRLRPPMSLTPQIWESSGWWERRFGAEAESWETTEIETAAPNVLDPQFLFKFVLHFWKQIDKFPTGSSYTNLFQVCIGEVVFTLDEKVQDRIGQGGLKVQSTSRDMVASRDWKYRAIQESKRLGLPEPFESMRGDPSLAEDT